MNDCELSALALSELWAVVASRPDEFEQFSERAAQIGIADLKEWAEQASERFRVSWAQSAGTADYGYPHVPLAAWIIAAGANTGPPSEFEGEIQRRVSAAWAVQHPGVPFGQSSALVIPAWTLGVAATATDRYLPVIPAFPHSDPNVSLAYDGLVNHVSRVFADDDATEMDLTSVLWRLGAIITAIHPDPAAPDEGKLSPTLQALMMKYGPRIDRTQNRRAEHAVIADDRNALTHMVTDRKGTEFHQVVAKYSTQKSTHGALYLLTDLLFAVINDETLDTPPDDAHRWLEEDDHLLGWLDDYV